MLFSVESCPLTHISVERPDSPPASNLQNPLDRLKGSLAARLHGKSDAIDAIVTCLLAEGHILIEDVPGVGKTTLAYVLAKSLDCQFNRIQFTSDILPSDILGVSIYKGSNNQFEFFKGPVFSNIVLADEINRASPKSQSALLEAMERGLVTIDGASRPIEPPFMVIATQNPIDFESTFPLPSAQLDRFMMRISMGYLEKEDESRMLRSGKLHYDHMDIEPVVSKAEIISLQEQVETVFMEDSLYEYLHEIILATRNRQNIDVGISPRGAIAFRSSVQAAALVAGRGFVSPEDIQRNAVPCLAHRLRLAHSLSGSYDWGRSAKIVGEILNEIPAPHAQD